MCRRPDLANIPGTVERSVAAKHISGCSILTIAIESYRLLYLKMFFVIMLAELRI